MTFLLSIDDTDSLDSRGTGRLARAIADTLSREYPVQCVTRHQLFVHESIPYTSHNSCAVIRVGPCAPDQEDRIFSLARDVMNGDFVEGSDPGIAIAHMNAVTPAVVTFGQDAKRKVLTQEKARTLARNCSIRLEGLGGTEDGVIGAMAGLGLASTGYDGRFLQKGTIRNIRGPALAETLLSAGIEMILTMEGIPVTNGMIMVQEGKSVKPCPVSGKAVLFVEERDGALHAVKRD
ncbi:MAG: ABC transporter substrate-binding protein [Methanolinea sp.]|nr:ABC transporter substrate-binding protein [Methanolinea sp.]